MKKNNFSERLVIAAGENSKAREYWLNKLSGDLVKTGFPADYNDRVTGAGQPTTHEIIHQFDRETAAKLMKLCDGSDVRLHMVMVTGLILLLNKYTGNNDIIMAAPIYKQETETEFVNSVLVLRNRVQENISFKELLLQVRHTINLASEHYDYPIEILADELNLTSPGKDDFPLFEIAALVENIHDKKYLQRINLKMLFSFKRTNGFIAGKVEYNALWYEKTTIERILKNLEHLLYRALSNTNLHVPDIDVISREEKKRLLYDFSHTAAAFPENKTIHGLFAEQAAKTPGHIAVVVENRQFTYKALDRKANQSALVLRRKGVGRDTVVGIMLARSPEMIAAILGVLKAGGAYLPIDKEWPISRITLMLEDCQASVFISRGNIIKKFPYTTFKGLHVVKKEPHITAMRPQVPAFNKIPIPDRSLVNYEKYSQHIGVALAKNVVSLQATRGCPYQCAYCHKIWPKTHIYRSAEHIFQEVRLLYDLGIRRFAIIDDIFNLKAENSKRFFQLILKSNLKLQLFFPAGMRGDILTKDYIDRMVEAGLVCLPLALETGSPRLQKLVKRNLDLNRLKQNIEYFCQKHPHVVLDLFTMLGFPTETEEEAMMTLNFIKSIKWLHFPYIFVLHIYPGTDMEKLALEDGITPGAIARSEDLYWHELPDTLPFSRSFARNYQAEFLNGYFLTKERLLHVLPYQMKVLTEEEIVQKYNTYLPVDLKKLDDLLEFAGIRADELGEKTLADDNHMAVEDLNNKIKKAFPAPGPFADGLRVLLLDLSQFFSRASDPLNELVEPPLGLMYLLTYLKQRFGRKINGKIAKSRIDFDNYRELKNILDEFKPEVIGIRTLTYYEDFFHQTAAMIRAWGINVPVIAGGPYGTSSYKNILQDKNVDLVVLGEGEITFGELIGKIMENDGKLPQDRVLKEIAGIAFIPESPHREKQLAREILLIDVPGGENHQYQDSLEPINQSTDLAYIIFTSGSTGKPKGVGVEHKGVVNMLTARKEEYGMKPESISMQLFPYTFDGFITSFFTPVISGARVILPAEHEILDMEKIKTIIKKNRVTHFISVPAFYRVMIENLTREEAVSLQMVTLAGDTLESRVLELSKVKNAQMEIINEYGVTECSVLSTLNRHQDRDGIVRIGRPIRNTIIYILGKQGQLQPIGVPGELCIGGVGVARGYLNNPGLTNKKFLPGGPGGTVFSKRVPPGPRRHPSARGPYKKIYHTGDLARWLADGTIEYLGRMDHQVKVRAFRIELTEIERVLAGHPLIKEVVVAAPEDEEKNKYLAAYYVGTRKNKDETPELWPSTAEFFVYDELLYYAMTHDESRNNSYKAAINRLVKDKIVVEVGTGADAILARFCVEAGAKKVYAVEMLEDSCKRALEKIKAWGMEDKIILIRGDARTVDIPGKADVCLSEIVGPIGGCEGAVPILNNARRFLNQNGKMIPWKAITKIAAVYLPPEIHETPGFTEITGKYVGKTFQQLGYPFDLRLCIKNFPHTNIISNDDIFEELNFLEVMAEQSTHQVNFTINNNARLDGFLIWLTLHTIEGEVIDILENQHCWLPVFVPVFYPGIEVSGGDTIEAECLRTLCENNLNPDYEIKGVLARKGAKNIEFRYLLPHFQGSYKQTPFYQKLFKDDSGNYVRNTPREPVLVSELREYLQQYLPGYMIPAYFVPMEKFPLTDAGKIDRVLLPAPGLKGSSAGYAAPGNEIEEILSGIWAEILGLEKIGVNDNFFQLGGDSIKAIQITARLRKHGIKAEISNLFSNQTIKDFAKSVERTNRTIHQGVIEGEVELSPIQQWFFEAKLTHNHHFNQSVMLFSQEGFEEETVSAVFEKIVEHHDALRMVYECEIDENGLESKARQRNRGLEGKLFHLEIFHMDGVDPVEQEIQKAANKIQSSINLKTGPLVKLALFKTANGNHLLIVIHHLVVDGISWRILLEDFSIGTKQALMGEEIKFPEKTDSFKHWTAKLKEYAASKVALNELAYWNALEETGIENLPGDYKIGKEKNKKKHSEIIRMNLTEEETRQLLTGVNQAYHTRVNDILLTALAMAMNRWKGMDKLLISLEGHGREPIIKDIDTSRTVGWFTSAYPVLLDISRANDISYKIKMVKESLRKIPNNGIGYGILKYLTPEEKKKGVKFNLEPGISFNFLGQFGQEIIENRPSAKPGINEVVKISRMNGGQPFSPEMEQIHALTIDGMIVNGELNFSFIYNKHEYERKSIENLSNDYKTNLLKIIEHCTSREEKKITPSDTGYSNINIEDLEYLESEINLID